MKNLIIFITFLLIAYSAFPQENCVSCEGNTVNYLGLSSAIGVNNYSNGQRSFASGERNSLKGDYSAAFGYGNSVSGISAFTAGNSNTVSGNYSAAFGETVIATGKVSFGFGKHTEAKGEGSLALGQYAKAWGNNSVAIGFGTQASVDFSYVFGRFIQANTSLAFIIGNGKGNNFMQNNISNSLMIGFNSSKPTFFVSESPGDEGLSTGRIGIGNVTNPLTKLHIKADPGEDAIIRLTPDDWSGSNTASLQFGDENYGIVAQYSQGLTFNSNNKDFIFNTDENGEVGIGTSYPSRTLDVDGTSRIRDDARFDGNVGIGTTNPSERLEVDGNILQSPGFNLTTTQIKAPDANGLNLTNQSGNGVFVDEGGNVGIGTTVAPAYKLDVNGDIRFTGQLYDINGQYDPSLWETNINGINYSSGNVGIGIPTPNEKLEVDGNILQTGGFNLTTSQIKAPDANGLSLTDMNGNGIFVGLSGNVGIGIPDPYYNLDVAGNINFTGSIRKNGEIFNPSYWDKNGSVIDYSGKVGIGTTDVNAKLKIFTDNSTGLIVNTQHTSGWGYGIISDVTHDDTKALVVEKRIDESTSDRFTVYGNGRTIIGNNDYPYSGYLLTVAGKVKAREVWVTPTAGADFVFVEGYDLPKLGDIEDFITENKHLPNIPSADQMIEDGLDLGDMHIKLLQKVEELTLYVIEQNKKIEKLESEVDKIRGE